MTSWASLSIFQDILVSFYFGSLFAYYAGIGLFFVVALSMAGIDFRLALVFSLPLIGAFTLYGAFGAHTWLGAILLLLVAIFYAYAIIDIFT